MRSEALRALLLACAVLVAVPAMAADLHAQVSASLMRPEQRSLRPMQWTPPPKLVALYFGADWCAPCHAFVPTLRSVRDALREAGADTEVVYVSLDESDAALRRYMHAQDMPWPVLDPRRAARMPALQALASWRRRIWY